jgi:hypothetical protein
MLPAAANILRTTTLQFCQSRTFAPAYTMSRKLVHKPESNAQGAVQLPVVTVWSDSATITIDLLGRLGVHEYTLAATGSKRL